MVDDAEWQLVLILWGTKYGVGEVNHLIETVRASASRPFRTVLITDRERQGLETGVVQRRFPDFFLREEMRGGGCQAKLVMYEAGVVPDDLPAIFMDIDTVVFGDMARFLDLPKSDKAVVLFQSAVLPIGPLGRLAWRMTDKRKYARGNSSIVVFHPRECGHIAQTFRKLQAEHGDFGVRPMIADERFMSWCAQEHLQAIPRRMAVKFPTEFMLHWPWLIRLRAAMPWVRARWAGLIAVTLPGVEVKRQVLLEMEEGGEVVDRKGRKLIWSEKAIGPMKARLIAYYTALVAREGD
ncbi:hypothetical protein CLV88_106154 [Shimia abyssi]|uniref:Glycosyl transferase family 2 n=2 Tax=Shimia abyssi TaxID=1662395 RepID=A0A2P8FCH6_9RHOB|nr:hypothetical protein CLV88_106154 [Shimia abyssi]